MYPGWRRLVLAALLLIALGGAFLLAWGLYGRDTATAIAAGAAVVVAVAVVVLPPAIAGLRTSQGSTSEQFERAAARLAIEVRQQWRQEARVRHLRDPEPLKVRWSMADPKLMDHPDLIIPEIQSLSHLPFRGGVRDAVHAFRGLPRRRLVVIGEPGAGKTGFLVLLTLGLLEDRRPEEPIPVLLSPSSWDPRNESFERWVQRRLEEDYPWLQAVGLHRPTVAADLVSQGLVMPLLDGLDEMIEVVRQAAHEAIDEVGPDRALVITCRKEEYIQLIDEGGAIAVAAVVKLEPVLPEDAETYIRHSVRPGPQLERWLPVFTKLRRHESDPVVEALSTALMVSLVRAVYSNGRADPRELLNRGRFPTKAAVEDHLLDAFIPALFEPASPLATGRRRQWTGDDARRWLIFLAKYLKRQGTQDLAWWQLYSAVSLRNQMLGSGLLGAVVGGLFLGGPFMNPLAVLGMAFLGGIAAALWRLTVYEEDVQNHPQRLTLGLQSAERSRIGHVRTDGNFTLAGSLIAALVLGVPLGLLGYLAERRLFGPAPLSPLGLVEPTVTGTLIVLLIMGLFGGNTLGKTAVGTDRVTSPGATLRSDLIVGLVNVLLAGLGTGLLSLLGYRLLLRFIPANIPLPASYVVFWFGFMIVLLSMFIGIFYAVWVGIGVRACIIYFVATRWMYFRGELPWRLMSFLQEMHGRGILRQVGAVYQFRHGRLQGRLAGIDDAASAPSPVDAKSTR